MSTYPFPQPFPTLRTCSACGRTFRLVDFRRWFGEKRVLFSTCNACQPEVPATRDSRTLQNAIVYGRISPAEAAIAKAQAAAREAKAHAKRSVAAQRRHASERKARWNAALFTPLRKEITHVRSAISICRLGQAPHFATGALPLRATALAYAAWQEFFEAYLTALHEVQRLAQLRLLNAQRASRVEPTPDDVDVASYISPETHAALRQLYSRCTPIPGRKSFREPWMLQWSETKGE